MPRLLAFLDGLGREYEIIIGSNGSTDSTTTLGTDLARRFPHVSFFLVAEYAHPLGLWFHARRVPT